MTPSELCWGEVLQAPLRAPHVVVNPPGLDMFTHIAEVEEPVFVKHLVSVTRIEALDLPVLLWFSRFDIVLANAPHRRPFAHDQARQLRAVIGFDHFGETAFLGDAFERSDNTVRWKHRVNLNHEAFVCKLIDQCQGSRFPPVR